MPTATYEPIQSQTASGSSSTLSFTSIPSTYTDLIFTGYLLADSGTPYSYFRLNNDSTAANYNSGWTQLVGVGLSSPTLIFGTAGYFIGNGWSNSYGTTGIASMHIDLQNYANTSKAKIWDAQYFSAYGSGSSAEYLFAYGTYTNTAAINRVDFIQSSGNIAAGSTITMWGVLRG